MKKPSNFPKSWTTSSYGGTVDTSPLDLSALGDHLGACKNTHGHLFALHHAAQTLHGFVAARLVTTLVFVVLLIGIVKLAL